VPVLLDDTTSVHTSADALAGLDTWLATRPGGADAGSGVRFLGRRREEMLSERALIEGCRGAG